MAEKDENAELDELLDAEMNKGEEAEVEESTVQTDEEQVESEAGTVDEEPVEIPEELQPYSTWKEEARQAWESGVANEEMREILKQIRPQLDSDYQYRTQLEQERAQLSQRAQVADQIDRLTQQYGDVFRGQDPMNVMGTYLYYGQQLAKDPQNTIQQLAKEYGVDLNQVTQDQPYVDEYTQKLQGELSQIQQQIQQQEAQRQQEQFNQVIQNANAFEFEADAEGNLLHPHVSKVSNQMLGLLQSGQARDFNEAYEAACWMNPEVRAELQKADGQSKKLQQKAQAQKAKAATSAMPKSGKSSVTAPKGVEDLDDALDRAEKEFAA